MPFEIRQTSLDAVAVCDCTFRITRSKDIGTLADAIARFGLLCGPILSPLNGRVVVVSGFSRLAACRHLGWRQIPARWPREPADPWRCALWAIAENAGQRPLDPLETGRALRLLRRFSPAEAEFLQAVRSLGLPERPAARARFAALCDLSEPLQDAVAEGILTLSTAEALGLMSSGEADRLGSLLVGLRFGANKQREVLELVGEIARREGRSIADVLETPALVGLVSDPDADRVQRGNRLRTYLYRRRYPSLSAARERFEAMSRVLCPDPRAWLTPPPGFEGRSFQLTFSFTCREDLARHPQTLERILAHPGLNETLGLT